MDGIKHNVTQQGHFATFLNFISGKKKVFFFFSKQVFLVTTTGLLICLLLTPAIPPRILYQSIF